MKRTISVLLAFVLLIALAAPAFAAETAGFTDVAAGAWYAEAVSFVQSRGLMAGTGNNRFSPDSPTTRAMLVTILYRSAGSPAVSTSAGFTDVRNDYYTDAVNWAAANNVVSGYGDGRFGVSDNVTRQDVATILWRREGRPAASSQDFVDESSIARDIWVAYYHPVYAQLFEDSGFRVKKELHDHTRDTVTKIYCYPTDDQG